MKLHLRQIITFSIIILTVYIFVLLLKEIGIWNTIVSIMKIAIQIGYGFLLALILEVYISRVPFQKRTVKVLVVYSCIGLFVGLLLWFGVPKFILYIQQLSVSLPTMVEVVSRWLPEDVVSYVPTISSFIFSKTQNLVDSFQGIGFIVTSSLFISLDLKSLTRNIKVDTNFISTADQIIFQYTKGISIDLFVLFVLFSGILCLFNFPEFLVVSIILALLNLFPIFGPLIGFGLLVILCFIMFESIPFLLLVCIFIVQQIESNWIQPFIFKKVMHLMPIITLISLFVCGSLFGIFGMLFSPIIAGIVQLIFRSFVFSKHNKTVGSWEDVWYNFED